MDFELMRSFYNRLEDEQSRFIFMCRWQYLLSGDESFLWKMVEGTDKYFHRKLSRKVNSIGLLLKKEDRNEIPVVLYGTGDMSKPILDKLNEEGIKIKAFCNSEVSKPGNTHLGLPVISRDSLLAGEIGQCRVVVSTLRFQFEICYDLIKSDFPFDNLFSITGAQYDSETQYFGPSFIKPVSDEIYVDCGAFDGASIRDFVCFNKEYKHIFAFEPHPTSYQTLDENIKLWNYERTSLINKASWKCEDILEFIVQDGQIAAQGSRIVSDAESVKENSLKVRANSIDNVVGKSKVTFIKLDVEGAELETLVGAKETIAKYRPRLAVSIYHKPEDIVELPMYIHKHWSDYRFYIRHHRDQSFDYPNLFCETILYAV